jgi:hypothetical protein
MQPIQEAIEYLESCKAGDNFLYREVAKRFRVNRVTLIRRHRGDNEAYGLRNRSLHLQHETELIQYINTLTERRLPPTKEIIQRFALDLARKLVLES